MAKIRVAPSDGAPHVMVDYIISAGHIGGNVQIHVGVEEARPSADGEKIEKIIVPSAHFRMSPAMATEMAKLLLQVVDNLNEGRQQKAVPVSLTN